MKHRLLELLACPYCGEAFSLEEFATSENADGQVEVEQGILRSLCGKWYPIVDAVPVILPNALDIYSDFAHEYADRLPEWPISADEIRRFEEEKKKTQESFGFEWTVYSTVRDERDEGYVLEGGLTPEFFTGKLVLDAGCGYGRHSRIVQEFGAEVVGIDLSVAVINARKITKDMPKVHIVQTDLFYPPFRKEIFDVVFSWGVLHHTPDPRRAFEGLVDFVKPGGDISVKIYRKRPAPARFIESLIRKVTLRLPLKTLYDLSYLCVPINWFYWAVGRHIPGVRELILGTIRCDRDWRISHIDTFDWYHPQYQFHFPMEEVQHWFEEKGLKGIVGVESKGVRACKQEKQAVSQVA
ncbi:MAG: methyltransferase domain-containing protein [Gemmatimonadetes bacterium]|jgi:SAM-dependent methyltransferase|nr:methyltransferase domain-containing protein [Gemmatimonadota bacterium]